MQPIRSLLVVGDELIRSSDHDHTLPTPGDGIRLAPTATGVGTADVEPWLQARRGGVAGQVPPDLCGWSVLLLEGARTWCDSGDGWVLVGPPEPEPERCGPEEEAVSSGGFGPAEPPVADPRVVLRAARGPGGRIWAVTERGDDRQLEVLQGLRRLATLAGPPGADRQLIDVGADRSRVVVLAEVAGEPAVFVSDGTDAWEALPLFVPEGELEERPVDVAALVPIAAAGHGDLLVVVLHEVGRGAWLGRVHADRVVLTRLYSVPGPGETEDDLSHLARWAVDAVVDHEAHVWLALPRGAPTAAVDLVRLLPDGDGWTAVGWYTGRGWDGRALVVDGEGTVRISTATGAVAVRRRREAMVQWGRVELRGLDSQRFGCVWHRIRIDGCFPPGTSVILSARCADEPPYDARDPRTPGGVSPLSGDHRVSLGSRTPGDTEGWVQLPVPLRRPWRADDPLVHAGNPAFEDPDRATLECLITTPPGRYLWLRIELRGTRWASPVVEAVRATYPRASLMDLLPAFWRTAPGADRMDRYLALFEGELTEMDQRITALPALFDPGATPPGALDWLASWVGLVFDQRIPEERRRMLLDERVAIYRRRGTVYGLQRLCEIVSGAECVIVEAFRLRRARGVVVGRTPGSPGGAVVGPGAELAGEVTVEAPAWSGDGDVDGGLYAELPTETTTVPDFFRRTAHRFQVLVAAPYDETLDAVLNTLIEANKPAHTIHGLCWLDRGVHLDVTAYVGLTRIGPPRCPPHAIADHATLGQGWRVDATPSPGTRIGPRQRGRTHLV